MVCEINSKMINEPYFIENLPKFYKLAYDKFKALYFQPQNSIKDRHEIFKAFCQEFTLLPHITQMHLINLKFVYPFKFSTVPLLSLLKDENDYIQNATDSTIKIIPQHLYDDDLYNFILSDKIEYYDNKNLKIHYDFDFCALKKLFGKGDLQYPFLDEKDLSDNKMDKFERLVVLPSKFIIETMEFYEERSTKFASPTLRKKHKNGCILYQKLQDAKDNDHQWQQLIPETNDEEFIIYSFNCRIGKNPTNQNLWKMLLEYLYTKTNNYSEFFATISRYCRFFVEDLEMRRIYFNELFKFSKQGKPLTNFWEDLILNEKQFASNESAEMIHKIALEFTHLQKSPLPDVGLHSTAQKKKKNPRKKTVIFNKKKILKQSTCFPFYISNYILHNASFPVLQRLYQSAKYFFIKNPKLLCFRLNVFESFGSNEPQLKYVQNSAIFDFINDPSFLIKNFKYDFCVSNSFFYTKSPFSNVKKNETAISALIKFVKVWRISYIRCNAPLTLSDLKILIKDSKILKADFRGSKILEAKNLNIQGFILLFPHAVVLKLPDGLKYSSDTNYALRVMKRKAKLKKFFVNFHPENTQNINPQAACYFIKNNAAPNSKFVLKVDQTQLNIFKTATNKLLQSWDPQQEKPVIKL